jgi:hypothetical protein
MPSCAFYTRRSYLPQPQEPTTGPYPMLSTGLTELKGTGKQERFYTVSYIYTKTLNLTEYQYAALCDYHFSYSFHR